ncbi:MAG: HlyC/CorC family transporter [bacterium]|nr:HlyC/CorC family transporter [bacterium]
MDILIFSLLLILNIVFYMLETSFRSFSRISLAGFIDDFGDDKTKTFDLVESYEMVVNSLRALSFFCQLGLFVFSYILLEPYLPEPFYRIVLLLFSFLFLFNFFLYTVAFTKREGILKGLISLIPVARVFFYPANIVFSKFLQKLPDEDDDLSEKEVEVFIEEGTKEGVLEKEDKELIESVIEFGDTLVKEIITPRVDMLYVEMGVELSQLITSINESKKSRYPVITDRIDNIEGIILAKDVFDYWNNDSNDFKIEKILRKPFFVPETMRILELLKEMQKSKQKFAVVADEFGGITGVVTMEDIIEEIVGEIHDEYDDDIEQIVEEKDYYLVKGDTDISELGDRLDIDLDDDEDYQTVAGLLSFKLGKIPGNGDRIEVEGFGFEVIDIEKNRVKKVRITPGN